MQIVVHLEDVFRELGIKDYYATVITGGKVITVKGGELENYQLLQAKPIKDGL